MKKAVWSMCIRLVLSRNGGPSARRLGRERRPARPGVAGQSHARAAASRSVVRSPASEYRVQTPQSPVWRARLRTTSSAAAPFTRGRRPTPPGSATASGRRPSSDVIHRERRAACCARHRRLRPARNRTADGWYDPAAHITSTRETPSPQAHERQAAVGLQHGWRERRPRSRRAREDGCAMLRDSAIVTLSRGSDATSRVGGAFGSGSLIVLLESAPRRWQPATAAASTRPTAIHQPTPPMRE